MRVEVPAAFAGERVDRVVATLTELARSEVATLVATGQVRLDGSVVGTRSRRVGEGQLLEVEIPPPPAVGLVPDPDVVVRVVHAHGAVVVVDKPAGLVVHPGAGHQSGTLAHGLLARFPELAGVGDPERPGIVHRLDRLTSGLLAVARTPEALVALGAQLADRTMGRRYLALVRGRVEAETGVVDAPVGRSARDPTRMTVTAEGRPARTGYEVRARFDDPVTVTLVECRLETGRTHQVRVHLAAIGHPVVGDVRYGGNRGQRGGRRSGDWAALAALDPMRPFLHAHALAFDHPVTGERTELTSALPPELAALLADLGAGADLCAPADPGDTGR
ncbi:MAG: RluA family pseudouridine synthase [Acidimicrobiales bacterium]